MKHLVKSFIALCLLAFCSAAHASFDGHYYGASPSGPFTGFEINISGSTVYGTAFVRGSGNDYVYFYNSSGVDRAGNIHGTFDGAFEGTFIGKALGNGASFTLKSRKGTATLLGIKSTPGYAFSSITGKGVYFNFPNQNESTTYVSIYFDSPTTAEVYIYNTSSGETYSVSRYTYKKTGPNTASFSVTGLGAGTITFTDSSDGILSVGGRIITCGIYDLED